MLAMAACKQHCSDVAIIGGGPAGSSLAVLLTERGITATVIEAGNYCGPSMGQSLSPSANPLLTQLDVDLAAGGGNRRSRGVSVSWGGRSLRSNEHFWTPYGNGWHVERPRFDRLLARKAIRAGALIFCNARVSSCSALPRQKWSLEFQTVGGLQRLQCRFLVDATGRIGCQTLPRAVRSTVYDRLIGITWVGKSAATCPYTLVETVEHGWVYASVMPDSRSTVVLMTDSDIYKSNRHKRTGFWDGELRQVRHILEMFPETLQSYPQRILSASTILRMPCSGVNWLKIGEAAVSFDPISGQGVYQALAGAVRAASVVEHYFRTGNTIRSYDAWVQRSFERYQSVLNGYYSQERRWARSPFWRRRHLDAVGSRSRVASSPDIVG